MSVVWVIERQKPNAAVHALVGDFAVRAFGSLQNFRRLLRLARRHPPSAVILDADDLDVPLAEAVSLIDEALPGVPLVALSEAYPALAGEAFFHFAKPIDPLGLVPFIQGIARGGVMRVLV